jgi:hypothetical protein
MRTKIMVYLGTIIVLLGFYAAFNAVGQWMEPKIRFHEQENAYCYTAGKMFFVSIACISKN